MTDEQTGTPPASHKWEPIDDLPENWRDLCRPDLHDVHRQWVAERRLIKDETKLRTFQEELELLWSIETGFIERLYRFDRGVTVQILEAGLEALGTHHASGLIGPDAQAHIADQRAALEMVMDLVGDENRDLSTSYIKSLHQRLVLSQETCEAMDQFGKPVQVPLRKGEWKLHPNNPLQPDGQIHEYCPPEQIPGEIERLLAWHKRHESLDVCAEVEAAWLHHRFTQIHPFQDGNGRVARAITGGVFLKAGYLVLVIRDEEHRDRYLDALETADAGDLRPLVDLFAEIQGADLRAALKLVRSLRGEEAVRAVEAAAAAARRTQGATAARVATALDALMRVAQVRLEEVAAEMQRAFESQGVIVWASVAGDETGDAASSNDIREIFDRNGYPIDPGRPWHWRALGLGLPARPDTDSRIAVMVAGSGDHPRQYRASALLLGGRDGGQRRGVTHFGRAWPFEVSPPGDDEFEKVAAGFREWLEEHITAGIRSWTRDL